jgi:aminoglycoside phosphotransferase (APT) family kinase protein
LTGWALLGTSKAGTTSWRALWQDRPVKILRCFSPHQARLVEWLGEEPALGRHFPRCIERREEIVVVEWVLGEPLGKLDYRRQPEQIAATARLLALIHSSPPPSEIRTEDVYGKYLTDRWARLAGAISSPAVTARLQSEIESARGDRPLLTHPDLSPQNLVMLPGNRLISIDNELVGVGPLPMIDLFSPWRYFGRGLRRTANTRRFLRAYVECGGRLERFHERARSYLALWRLRRIGALLEQGRTAEARLIEDAVLSRSAKEHPLLRAVRRSLP